MRGVAKDRPCLSCPECGADLLPARCRGRVDRDGNEIVHRAECRCRWCDWMWWDDEAPTRCECGELVRVSVDDGHAYAETVRTAKSAAGGEHG